VNGLYRQIARVALLSISMASLFAAPATSHASPQNSTSPASSGTGSAQSVAAAAQEAKARKTAKATKVFSDDDMDLRKSPLPRLNLDGDDNSDDVLDAILKYRQAHKPEENEQAVHDWYDEFDTLLGAAIHDTVDSRSLRQSNVTNGYELCQLGGDYERCEKRRQAEARGARLDAAHMQQDGQRISRIQQAFIKIRNGLERNQLHYSWFKVRNANGVGNF
jgi:hypothetical protein